MAALCLHFPAVNILYFLLIPDGLFWCSYGSRVNIKSGPYVSITFIRLYFHDFEFCRFIRRQLICFRPDPDDLNLFSLYRLYMLLFDLFLYVAITASKLGQSLLNAEWF